MKIIGTAERGFIVEMTLEEIARAAGYSSAHDSNFINSTGRRDLPIGTIIDVKAAYDYHSRMASHQAQARSSAGIMRAMADMIEGAMPDVILPPKPEKEAGQ